MATMMRSHGDHHKEPAAALKGTSHASKMASSEAMVKLMTLINVSAAKPNKRRQNIEATFAPIHNNKRSKANGVEAGSPSNAKDGEENVSHAGVGGTAEQASGVASAGQPQGSGSASSLQRPATIEAEVDVASDDDDINNADENQGAKANQADAPADAFHYHFAAEGDASLASKAHPYASMDKGKEPAMEWQTSTTTLPSLGHASVSHVKDESLLDVPAAKPHAKILDAFTRRRQPSAMQAAMAELLGTYQDVVDTHVSLESHEALRRVTAMHALSHVTKVRRRVLRNNERLAKAATTGHSVQADVRDQGFTRPRVLILVPFRNSATAWMAHLSRMSGCEQIDNQARFKNDFGLPEGTVDKLAQPEALSKYPADHVETFKGNIDDNFRLGAKLTRKSWRIFSQFYDSDVIMATPLGLRLAIEKDRDSDFLSSIEVLIADQMDVMAMQNWEHVEFVMRHLNQIPKEAHDADFSRIKQWYLDGLAPLLRQSVLLSSYDTPELRRLVRSSLRNVAGRVHLDSAVEKGVLSDVRSGIRQTFQRFVCNNMQLEAALRLETFLTKTLPTLQKSALSSSRTLVFVPSYLDFVQLQEALRTQHPEVFSATAMLSEYSSGSDISRSRARFVTEKKRFLVVTERFVFYRRYILRGARTIVWYGLPDHAVYYSEMLENMFKPRDKDSGNAKKSKAPQEEEDDEVDVDVGDVSVMALFCKYDYMRLARIVGTDQARRMVRQDKATWRFA